MSNQKANITTEKLFETIGIQTVQLQIHQANIAQLAAENKRLADLLNPQKDEVRAEDS